MAKKPIKKKEVAVEATSSVRTASGAVYTVKFGNKAKLGDKFNATSK